MKIISNIFYATFVIVLLAVAALFLSSLFKIPGNIEMKIVKSGSMEPGLHTGSIAVIKPQGSYAVGDVITFGEDSKLKIPTTHRIVAIREDGGQTLYTTKGDANEDSDPDQTPMTKVIGKVLVAVPYAGFILDFARKPIGFTLLIAIPAGIIILDESIRIVQEIAALRRKRRGVDMQQV